MLIWPWNCFSLHTVTAQFLIILTITSEVRDQKLFGSDATPHSSLKLHKFASIRNIKPHRLSQDYDYVMPYGTRCTHNSYQDYSISDIILSGMTTESAVQVSEDRRKIKTQLTREEAERRESKNSRETQSTALRYAKTSSLAGEETALRIQRSARIRRRRKIIRLGPLNPRRDQDGRKLNPGLPPATSNSGRRQRRGKNRGERERGRERVRNVILFLLSFPINNNFLSILFPLFIYAFSCFYFPFFFAI